MTLSEHETRVLDGLERALREDDPKLDRLLRRMPSPGETMSVLLALGILAAFSLGLALLVMGNHYGATVMTVIGMTLMVVVPSGIMLWGSRRYYYPGCNHAATVSTEHCPRCA
jgi:Protein of unknown function (DUF3040)